MPLSRNPAASPQPVLVAANAHSLRQWEFELQEREPATAAAWISPPLVTAERWLAETHEATADGDSRAAGLISPGQAHALWAEVVAGSDVGSTLISARSAAVWAADAWARLGHWEIDPGRLAADAVQDDHRAALGWFRSFDRRLRDANWIDGVGLLRELNDGRALTPRDAVLLDPDAMLTPARQRFVERMRLAGASIEMRPPKPVRARCHVGRFEDPSLELAQAIEWARATLERGPETRIALVLPELAERRADVRARLAETFDGLDGTAADGEGAAFWLEYGPRLDEVPAYGAAATALELLSAEGTFTALSRWLRSPFFRAASPAEQGMRAALEAELRGELYAQLRFVEAFRRHGLRQRLRRTVPATADALDRALAVLAAAPLRAAPTQWSAVWQTSLRELGWTGPGHGTPAEAVTAWDRALAQFAELTPVLGAVGAGRALAEFRRLLHDNRVQTPMPTRGLLVIDHPGKIGAGCAAAWITGFSDRRWPEPVALNPLLSRKLQAANEMPRATPRLAYADSLRQLEGLASRVPLLLFSSPARIEDRVAEPSTMLRVLDPEPLEAAAGATAARSRTAVARPVEELRDPAPPLRGNRISGGARTLDLQAACPLRAFCESRLGARPLEPLTRGFSPRLRGVVMHAALEHLYAGRDAADGFDAGYTRTRVAESVDRALAGAIPWSVAPWNTLVRLERARMEKLLAALLELEAERPQFAVIEREGRLEVDLAGRSLRCRIDRADRLDDGSLAVIDYKTGTGGSVKDWFRDRLLSTQLPVYALELGDAVSALVLVVLQDRGVEYRGSAKEPDLIARRIGTVPEGRSWAEQLERWRRQLGELVEEYAAGDLRVFADATTLAEGAYAPLTRIYELMAEAHWLPAEPPA